MKNQNRRTSVERVILGIIVGALLGAVVASGLLAARQVGWLLVLAFGGAAIGAFLGFGGIRYWRRAVQSLGGSDLLRGSPSLRCGECRAASRPEAKYCWLCGAVLVPAAEDAAQPTAAEGRAAYQFGISTIMLVITITAVLLGVFRMSVGVGLALVFLFTPALVRTCIIAVRRKARGHPMSVPAKLGVFAATFGIVIVVVAASIGAFFAVCFTLVWEM